MKNFIIVLLIGFSFESFSRLIPAVVPYQLSEAVDRNYDFGRHSADFGGISEIKLYKTSKRMSFKQIIAQVIRDGDAVTDLLKQDYGSIWQLSDMILNRSPRILANTQPKSAFHLINELKLDNSGEIAKSLFLTATYRRLIGI